jgi:hypothetical protein
MLRSFSLLACVFSFILSEPARAADATLTESFIKIITEQINASQAKALETNFRHDPFTFTHEENPKKEPVEVKKMPGAIKTIDSKWYVVEKIKFSNYEDKFGPHFQWERWRDANGIESEMITVQHDHRIAKAFSMQSSYTFSSDDDPVAFAQIKSFFLRVRDAALTRMMNPAKTSNQGDERGFFSSCGELLPNIQNKKT